MSNLTIKKNVSHLLPLVVAVTFWAIGYVARWHAWDIGICKNYYGKCAEIMQKDIGNPMMTLGIWILLATIIMLFAPAVALKRWSIFAVIYLFVTGILIALGDTSTGGIGFNEKLFIAHVSGAVFLVVTLLWVVIHTIILRRREKQTALR